MDASIVQVSRRDAGAAHGIPCRSPASSMQCSQRALQARRGIPGAVSWACERMDWQGPSMPCGAVDGCVERACVCVCVCVWWCGDVFFSLLKEREGKRCKGDGQKGGGEKKRREGEGGAGRRPGHGVGHGCCTDPNREPTKTRDECRVIGRQRRICRASSLRRFTGRANSRAKLFRVSLGSSGPEAAKIPTWRSTHARQARSLLKLGAHRPL